MTPVLRPIADDDWPHIVALEAQTYATSGLSEDPTHLASRSDPTASFVLATRNGIAGYLLALPYPVFGYPDPARAEQTAFVSSNLHLHDIVIQPTYRRRHWGSRLVNHLLDAARQQAYHTVSLISVGDSATFWLAHGFQRHNEILLPDIYGPEATYMSASLCAALDQPTDGTRHDRTYLGAMPCRSPEDSYTVRRPRFPTSVETAKRISPRFPYGT